MLGVEELSHHLLPLIYGLVEDREWRVRISALHFLPLLAEQLVCCIGKVQLIPNRASSFLTKS